MSFTPDPPDNIDLAGYAHREFTRISDGLVAPDVSQQVSVGYTRTIEAVPSIESGTLTVDFTRQDLKTITVTGSFTLGEPTTNGHAELYVTVTGAGGYTVTPGANVQTVGTFPSLATGTNYIINVRRYGEDIAVAQIVALT